MESQCEGGQDDDCDALIDCADPDCNGQVCSLAGGNYLCGSPTCNCQGGETEETTCNDGNDNDCDGNTDCADQGFCSSAPICASCNPDQCNNVFGACSTDADCLACQVCSDGNGSPVNTCIPIQNCFNDGDCAPLLACDIGATCDTAAGVCR